jgi:hypothetical protein
MPSSKKEEESKLPMNSFLYPHNLPKTLPPSFLLLLPPLHPQVTELLKEKSNSHAYPPLLVVLSCFLLLLLLLHLEGGWRRKGGTDGGGRGVGVVVGGEGKCKCGKKVGEEEEESEISE